MEKPKKYSGCAKYSIPGYGQLTITEMVNTFGVSRGKIYGRLKRGVSGLFLVDKGSFPNGRKAATFNFTINGAFYQSLTINEICAISGLPYSQVRQRINAGIFHDVKRRYPKKEFAKKEGISYTRVIQLIQKGKVVYVNGELVRISKG